MQKDNYISNGKQQQVDNDSGKGFDPRYLAAKKSIDDKALNHRVLEMLQSNLPNATSNEPLKILEIGAGIGTMLERLVDWEVLTGHVSYLATDMDPLQLKSAQTYLPKWAKKNGHSLVWSGNAGILRTQNVEISLKLEAARAEDLAERADSLGPLHLIVAHAVLDLVDFPAVLPQILARLINDGLAYFTCNFDGETVFLPDYSEEEIMRYYHNSMEARLAGASKTGRRLMTFLHSSGFEILAAGSSDWVIHPRRGGYSLDESFFLHAIIETVAKELAKIDNPTFNHATLANWVRLRHRQIETGELSFLARNLDLLVQNHPALL